MGFPARAVDLGLGYIKPLTGLLAGKRQSLRQGSALLGKRAKNQKVGVVNSGYVFSGTFAPGSVIFKVILLPIVLLI